MNADLNPSRIQFKDPDVGYRIIEHLIEIERKDLQRFYSIISFIQKIYQEANGMIGKSTVMGNTHKVLHDGRGDVLYLDDFMERRFQNSELGCQIILTLIEIEAREIEIDTLYSILGMIEEVDGDLLAHKDPLQPTAKILPFPK